MFACALCNGGTEFVRRQQITFDDLVHLLLYNLSVHNEQRSYFEVAGVIVPYAIDNWHMLQLTPEVWKVERVCVFVCNLLLKHSWLACQH